MRLAVFGARPGSLGAEVAGEALRLGAAERVRTYGISGHEDVEASLPCGDTDWIEDIFNFRPTDIFVTVGVNLPATMAWEKNGSGDSAYSLEWSKAMMESLVVNTIAPLKVLRVASAVGGVHSFSAVSSNSAHIARRGSSPYCASKAALSMALRVAARERVVPLVYGYELGLLAGTPMTEDSVRQFGSNLTRMVGAEEGLPLNEVARIIIGNLCEPSIALNGVMLRLDAGEQ